MNRTSACVNGPGRSDLGAVRSASIADSTAKTARSHVATFVREPGDDRIQQLSVLAANRTVALGSIIGSLAEEHIRIVAISILAAGDHAVIRLVVNRPAPAILALERLGYPVLRSDLLGVALPLGDEPEIGIRKVIAALVAAEVRVEYVYALISPVE